MKQGLVKIAKWLMVVLFMSYYFSTTLFYHTHHFQWGTVTHSHPYIPFEGGMPSHSHTAEQCATIGLLSAIVLWIAVAPALLFARTIVTPIYGQVFASHGFSGNSFRRGKSVCFL